MNLWKKRHVGYILGCAIIILSAFLISKYIWQIALVQGDSMLPSYHNLQLVVINKKFEDILVGDVIAFRSDSFNAILIKRVVALPGDSVEIKEGTLYVNGVPNSCINSNEKITYAGIAQTQLTLGEDEYFVLGDNYAYSKDSRYEEVGCISHNNIIGKVYP